jgi:hypothetical protein
MKQVTDNLNDLVGEQFIEWAMDYILAEMKKWPVVQKIAVVSVKPEKIRKFMLQEFLAAEALLGTREGDPGFLRFAIANLSESNDPTAESALETIDQKRTAEMTGHRVEKGIIQTPHRELWIKLLKALGAVDEELDRAEPKEVTRTYIAELSDVYSNAEWQTAVGAFSAHERVIGEEYKILRQMLKNNTTLTEKDLEILNYNSQDTKYVGNTSHILDKLVFDLESKQLVWEGIQKQLTQRQEFLDGLIKYLEN